MYLKQEFLNIVRYRTIYLAARYEFLVTSTYCYKNVPANKCCAFSKVLVLLETNVLLFNKVVKIFTASLHKRKVALKHKTIMHCMCFIKNDQKHIIDWQRLHAFD